MPFPAVLLLMISIGLCLVPVFLLFRQRYVRAQDYFVSSGFTPPEVIRNSSTAHTLRLASFGPLFGWGAGGDFWPVLIGAASLGLGLAFIYLLRRPILAFLGNALSTDQSITVHEFIARQHGNNACVRLLAASLTVFALFALVVAEVFALSAFLKPLLTETAVYVAALGILLLMLLYAAPSGHSGAMQAAQWQLGMVYLGLFISTALLLYLQVSALAPMRPHGRLAIVIVAICCCLILYYRRSKYVDTSPIVPDRKTVVAKPFRRFGKILNPVISVFAVVLIVLAFMEFYFVGLPVIVSDSATALKAGTSISGAGLITLILLPLFQPITDVTYWQRIAALEKNGNSGTAMPDSYGLRRIFRVLALEGPLWWLFMGAFGAIAVGALKIPAGGNVLQAFIQQLASGQNPVAAAAFAFFLVGIFALALSTMNSAFCASLCTIRYDILPALRPQWTAGGLQEVDEAVARRRILYAGGILLLAIAGAFYLADASLQISITSSTFLALIFASCCAQLCFAPLLFGPVISGTNAGGATLSQQWALAVPASGAAGAAAAVALFLATGQEAWLWASVPVCLGAGFLMFAVARRGAAEKAPAA